MADSKITALTSISTSTDPANDPLVIVDVSDTSMAATGTTKKVTLNQLLGASGTATLASATITGDLTVDTSTLKVDSANNRVGVGTATPGVRFDILSDNNTSLAAVLRVNSNNAAVNTSLAYDGLVGSGAMTLQCGVAPFVVNTNGANERYRIASDGVATWSNVGGVAGTAMTLNSTGLGVGTSPTTKLDVLGSGDGELRLRAGSDAALIFSETAANKNWKLKPSGGDFQFQYSATAYNSGYSPLMYLTATGNVGIGVTPSAWASYKALQVGSIGSLSSVTGATIVGNNWFYDGVSKYITTAASTIYEQGAGTHAWYSAASGSAGTAVSFGAAKMTLDASGNLLVGTTAMPSGILGARLVAKSTSADWTGVIWNSNATPYGFRIQHDTDSNNTGNDFLNCVGAANLRASIRSNGGIANYQANDVSLSDSRLKTDIKPLASYWNKIKSLELVTFKYKDQTHSDDNIGLIAQQVESVAPELVDVDGFGETPSDGVPIKTIYTTDLYHASIKALQEAMARIEALEAKLA